VEGFGERGEEEKRKEKKGKRKRQVDCSLREQMVGTGGWTKKEQEVVS